MDKTKIKEIVSRIDEKKWQEALDLVNNLTEIEPPLDFLVMNKIIEHLKEEEYGPAKILLGTILKQNPNCTFAQELFEKYQHIFNSQDITISEGSVVSPGADTSKIIRVEAETQMTVVDRNVSENPWDLESQQLTQVISDKSVSEIQVQANSQFLDASTITKANKIGPYENLIEIGRGGMGVVYKAYDTQNNRYVALKTIKEDDVPEEIKDRFIREMDIVSKLDHPNIIRVYDKFFYNDRMFFTMEFINGHTLKDLRDEGRPFPLEEVIEIMLRICDALEHAHEKGIIHRDLKPSNIMLDINNHVKVVDFGIAKKMGEEKYTRTGQVVGSIQYMPPEQMNGSIHDIDEQSDVYTIGAILYEMIMGVPPFPTPKIKNEMPKTLKYICLKCLHEEKTGRYQSVTALKRDLLTFSRNLAETKTQRRNKWLLRTVSALVIFTLAGYSFWLYQKAEELHSKVKQKDTEIGYLRQEIKEAGIQQTISQGEIAYLSGEYGKAIDYFNKVIQEKQNEVIVYEKRAYAYIGMEKFKEAIKDFDVVIQENSQNISAYFYSAQAYQKLGDYPNAINYLEKVILLDQNHRSAHLALAKIYLKKEGFDKAFQYIDKVFEIDQNTELNKELAEPYYLKGELLLAKNDTIKAIKHIFFGYCIDSGSISPEANTVLQKFLENEAIFTRNIVLFHHRYPTESLKYFAQQKSNEGFFEAATGYIYENQKEYNDALNMYEKAAQKNSEWEYLVAKLYLNGWGVEQNQEKAKEILEKLANNHFSIAMVYLGKMYMSGIGVNMSRENAFLWFQKAAKMENFDAMTEAAILMFTGRGTTKNQPEAVALLEKAALNYSTQAMNVLSQLYEKGNYVMMDKQKALQLKEEAQKIELYFSIQEK